MGGPARAGRAELRCAMFRPSALANLALATLLAAPGAAAQRNVILMVGDGMDDQQLSIARNYLHGARGRLGMDGLPVRGAVQVLTVAADGRTPVYVADSASSATVLATGEVTSRGRISVAADGFTQLRTIAEMARAAGYKTGIVATSSVTDATPAAFVAHVGLRYCENPEAMGSPELAGIDTRECALHTLASGGKGSISRQLAESGADVVLGGGMRHFQPRAEGESGSVLALARANGYQVVTDAAELDAAPVGERLLGLFSPSTMPVALRGEGGRRAEKPVPSWAHHIFKYFGTVDYPEPMRCEPNPDFAAMPTLRRMTEAALRHLANDKGFFLMVESASIDKQAHERRPCGSLGEVRQLDEALGAALAFAEAHPDTLILVTADHSQAAQMVPARSLFSAFGVPVFTPGAMARIRTPEGAIMGVNYATNEFLYEEHTGANVPLFANGEGIGRVPAMLAQPELFEIMRDYLDI